MTQSGAAAKLEVEIKVRLRDRADFSARLVASGFTMETPETLERNTLFDTPERFLRQRKQLLRIRRYGERWVLTHKAPPEIAVSTAHKARVETETEIGDGEALAVVFARLGYAPVFVYEKLRSEWTDGVGQVVVDVTPIGDFAELEGAPGWIDATAERLGIARSEYLTTSYGQMFLDWKAAEEHAALNMTFAEVGDFSRR